MAKHGLPTAKDIKFRSLRIDLDKIEPPPFEQIVDSNLVDLPFHDNLVTEKGRVLAVERTAGRLQPLLGQEQLRAARFVRSGDGVLLEGKLRQLVLAKGIGLDQRRHAIGKHIEELSGEGSNMRTDIEQRARRVTLKAQPVQNLFVHRVPVLRRIVGVSASRLPEFLGISTACLKVSPSTSAMSLAVQTRSSARMGRARCRRASFALYSP